MSLEAYRGKVRCGEVRLGDVVSGAVLKRLGLRLVG